MGKITILASVIVAATLLSCVQDRNTEVNSGKPCVPVDPATDMAGFIDPVVGVLYCVESDRSSILEFLNSRKINDSEYTAPWKSISGNSMTLTFQAYSVLQTAILLYVSKADKNIADILASSDTSRAEFVQEFVDKTGTYARIYREAICNTVSVESVTPCSEIVVFTISIPPDTLKYSWLDAPQLFPKNNSRVIRTGKYNTFRSLQVKNCLKGGNNYCVEELVVAEIESIYADKACSQLLETKNSYRYSCR